MNYIEMNKAAWEEAFDHRHLNWGDDNHLILKSGDYAFFNDDTKKELRNINVQGKAIAQFCCNNGRELLSFTVSGGARRGVGFDIAENILEQAKETAVKAGITNCEFVPCDILEIPECYHDQFDVIFFTIGAITWFKDLTLLFEKVSKCLKNGGIVFINDFHPVINMFPLPCDEGYDPNNLNRYTHSYFSKEPWIENDGMGYMSSKYQSSETFTSFSHTMSDIINALSEHGLKTVKLNEYDYDIGITEDYNHKGIPLSFILMAEKR